MAERFPGSRHTGTREGWLAAQLELFKAENELTPARRRTGAAMTSTTTGESLPNPPGWPSRDAGGGLGTAAAWLSVLAGARHDQP